MGGCPPSATRTAFRLLPGTPSVLFSLGPHRRPSGGVYLGPRRCGPARPELGRFARAAGPGRRLCGERGGPLARRPRCVGRNPNQPESGFFFARRGIPLAAPRGFVWRGETVPATPATRRSPPASPCLPGVPFPPRPPNPIALESSLPARPTPFAKRKSPPKKVVHFAAGASHTCAVTSDGELYASGCNDRGQLGRRPACAEEPSSSAPSSSSSMPGALAPFRVAALDALRVVQVACGGGHTLAVTEGGELLAWGSSESGQLGLVCVPLFFPRPRVCSFWRARAARCRCRCRSSRPAAPSPRARALSPGRPS